MARSKKEPPSPPAIAPWMATFSDLMNLLLCFFVLLFSFSTIEDEVFDQIAQSFNTTVSIFAGGAQAVGDGMLVSNGVSELNQLSEYFSTVGVSDTGETENTLEEFKEALEEEKLEAGEQMAEEIEAELEKNDMESEIEVNYTSQYVELVLNGSLLFKSGSDNIKSESKPVLSKVADILWKYDDCIVEIVGHCDNVQVPKSSKYDSNLDLSCARAISVAKYLYDEEGLPMEMLKPSGRGEYEPIASNDTSEGRALNRRVEIKIHFDID